jgi:hypothetical protein
MADDAMALRVESGALIAQAQAIGSIATEDAFHRASELAVAAQGLLGKIEASCEPVIKAAHAAHKAALQQKRDFAEPLQNVLASLRVRIAEWLRLEQIRRDAEAKRLGELAKLRAQDAALDEAAEAEALGDQVAALAILEAAEDAPAPAIIIPAARHDGISPRKTWSFRVQDFSALPDQYKKADEVSIRKVVNALGDRHNIPGVQAFEVNGIAIRA